MLKTNQRYLLTKFNWQLDDSYLNITLLQIKRKGERKKKITQLPPVLLCNFKRTNSTNDVNAKRR